ncbi:radical SAM protein [Laceyella tengchongensis]|uniref:radical SAM protein n=1 Tax=Laceyella tengchongensis TaxID=574699 RepID=UPI0012B97301|nr:radical SAM protein [Laceyella tengchongensis]
MAKRALIFDCYTVEPAGLGVPPYLSSYVRYAFSALQASGQYEEIAYATIDDFRTAVGIKTEYAVMRGFSDPLTYSKTYNAPRILELLSEADTVVLIAGDAVPSVHLHAINGELSEIVQAMNHVRGSRIVLGPASNYLRDSTHPENRQFQAFHAQNFSPENMLQGSTAPISYERLNSLIGTYEPLVAQIPWKVIAEIELYRGCTRSKYCAFCNEPVKNRIVDFRPPEDVIREIGLLYDAGVRNFRLGQQACFFSYYNRDVAKIEQLLSGIRERCPQLEVLHIDNVDPLAAASVQGKKIAKLVVEYCTEGNCAPMGIESFDQNVVKVNNLTCTPEVLIRAISNIQEFGAEVGPLGQGKLLPGLNLIYGLPGGSRYTHLENMKWLLKIMDEGYHCSRTNVRMVKVYQGTGLEDKDLSGNKTLEHDFETWKRDISELYDRPMKERVFPTGTVHRNLHSFFVNEQGTWFRRLGSYPIMVIVPNTSFPLYEEHDLVVTEHGGRHIYGETIRSVTGTGR